MTFALRAAASVRPHLTRGRRMMSAVAFQEGGQAPRAADAAPSAVKPQAQPKVKLGDSIPMQQKVWLYRAGEADPKEVPVSEVLGNKKAVLFGLPGAYTSVCSSKHVPEYFSKAKDLQQAGVEIIACTSVNDPYVMRKWAEELKVDQSVILMVGDADASFHDAMGLTQVIPGLGTRARRYSMYLENGKIMVLNIEEPGGKSYKVSGPSHMLDDLKQLQNRA